MKRTFALWLVAFIVSCSMSKQEKQELLSEIEKEISNVQMESKGFGSQQQAVESFIERRENEFAELKELMHRTIGDDGQVERLDRFYMTGLLDEVRLRGDDISFHSVKRMTERRLEQLKGRIETNVVDHGLQEPLVALLSDGFTTSRWRRGR